MPNGLEEKHNMSVNKNINGVLNAINEGRMAFSKTNFGPVTDPRLSFIEYTVGDWQDVNFDPDIFLWGLDKWGSKTQSVTK